ncbi:hypothetical protein TNCV_3114521 [Trichonephila clavipes]|nr:hypothetical protein TNCV_3114521 [Trichonephila clavipes]
MVVSVRATLNEHWIIDGACLTEETDTSEDGGKIASRKEWSLEIRTNYRGISLNLKFLCLEKIPLLPRVITEAGHRFLALSARGEDKLLSQLVADYFMASKFAYAMQENTFPGRKTVMGS